MASSEEKLLDIDSLLGLDEVLVRSEELQNVKSGSTGEETSLDGKGRVLQLKPVKSI